jgi:AcrR family transcriptional regulator
MKKKIRATDPRVKRTQELLLHAFSALLQEKKSIRSISIKDITDCATVNRATFYAHFADKYTLVDNWMRKQFRQTLFDKLPSPSSSLTTFHLYTLIIAVFEFAAQFQQHRKPVNKFVEPLLEAALQQEIYNILLSLLPNMPSSTIQSEEKRKEAANFASWAIFGSALAWARNQTPPAKEDAAQQILGFLTKGMFGFLAH